MIKLLTLMFRFLKSIIKLKRKLKNDESKIKKHRLSVEVTKPKPRSTYKKPLPKKYKRNIFSKQFN